MATSTSPARSARNIVDMQLVEYSFARWVYIDKCDDFVDAFGIPTLDMKAVADTLGSDATCIRALVLHGQYVRYVPIDAHHLMSDNVA